ncbi:MAG TPA: phage baseplate assembly protein V [Kofleriaceae bacterium]|jgi:uncharacterized protein involved in type VI secretion and phage assembly
MYGLANIFAQQIRDSESESGKMYEAAVAIVTDNKDPSKLGRVKVKIPVFSDDDTSWWCPIVMLGAGKNRGWFFIPEVDDEVLVVFEHGDIHKPLVVGALWGGKDKPPDTNPGGVPRRTIKSRQGSKITFDDENGKITLEDGTGKGTVTFDAAANKIIIEAKDGDVCFQAPDGDIVIVAKSVELKATQNLEINAGTSTQWGSDAKVTISGQATTIAGSQGTANCAASSMPTAPTATPADVADPYGS